MTELSNLYKANVLDLLIGSTRYLALLTDTPLAADTGSTISEPDYTGYARVAITSGQWAALSNSRRKNNVVVSFPVVDENVTVAGVALLSASTAGDLIAFDTLAVVLSIGETPRFALNTLSLAVPGYI